jgi:elongation factor Ts
MSDIELIKSIRERTGLSLAEIKKVVATSAGKSEDEIIDILRKNGVLKQQAKIGRDTNNGKIFTYNHEGKVGVAVVLKCETDFVAKNLDFISLGDDICLQIAAYEPKFLKPEEVNEEFIIKELEIAKEQLKAEGKNDEIIEKILAGKKTKIVSEVCLTTQSYIKNPSLTITDKIAEVIQKTGENIFIDKFVIVKLS